MKKLVTLLLVLAMIFNITIIATANEAKTMISEVPASNLPQLGSATELTWGIERGTRWDSETATMVDDPSADQIIPGVVSFKRASLDQGQYYIQLYKVGRSQPVISYGTNLRTDSGDKTTWL